MDTKHALIEINLPFKLIGVLLTLFFASNLIATEFIGFTKVQELQINLLVGNAKRCAVEYSIRTGNPVIQLSSPRGFVLYDSPTDLAESLGLPEKVLGGTVVARCNIETGVVYISKPFFDDATLYYECGRWFFKDSSGMETGSSEMERFAEFCKEQVSIGITLIGLEEKQLVSLNKIKAP